MHASACLVLHPADLPGRTRVRTLKLYACLAQVFGIINIVWCIFSFIAIQLDTVAAWPGAILCLVIGIPATVASSMYDPCGCCSCGTGSSRLKTIAMLCIVAAVAAFAVIVTCAAIMGQVASWPAPKEYVC